MKISRTNGKWLSAVAFLFIVSSNQRADAQVLITGRTAGDNAASAGGRSPGALATAGVGRALQAARDGRSIHGISEQQATSTGPRGQFIASAGGTLVTQVFDFFFFFVNRFLARAGLPPLFPGGLTAPDLGGGTGGTPAVGGDTPGTGTGDPTGTGGTTGGETSTPPQTGTGDTTGTGTGDSTGTINTTGTDIVVETGTVSAPGGVGTSGGRRPVRKTTASSGR